MPCCHRGRASACSACGPPPCSAPRPGCFAGVMSERAAKRTMGVMDGVTLTTGRPGRTSAGRPAGGRWPRLTRLLREPFTRRAWAEFGYAIASVPLAVAGFIFTVGTLVLGVGLTLTIVGVVIGPLLIAASTPGVLGLGGATRWLARRLLGIEVAGPPPPRRNPGVTGWFWSALNDATAWRTRGYLALKLPLSLFAGYVAGWFWLGGLAYLTYPLWWEIFHGISYRADGVTHPDPVTNPGPFGSVHVLTLPGSFALIPVGVVALLAAPWVTSAVVAVDRALIGRLLGP